MALATLAQIRAGLNTRLATISGLQTYAYMPGTITLPCAFVGGPREVEYHGAMATGLNVWTMNIWALVSTAPPNVESQADLDEMISPTGTKSIKLAVEGTTPPQTLSSVVADVVVDSCSGYAVYVTEQASYLGAEFTVRVFAGV